MRSSFHTAGWVMINPEVWIQRGVVEIRDGRIEAVHRGLRDARAIDHGPGVIMPALVNAHTHLSLSALRGRLDTCNGFIEWVRQLIEKRADLPEEECSSAAGKAARAVKLSGTGLIAEVGPLEPGTSAMAHADLQGIVFRESLGSQPAQLSLPLDDNGVCFSHAGHALHTTAPEVLRQLKVAVAERKGLFSLHLAESAAETEFLSTGRGPWAALLESRNIDFSAWELGGERPVPRAERIGLLGPDTLAVHLLEVNATEVDALARSRTSVCVCPRSNALLHGKLPDIQGFLGAGLNVALGTDSLASVPSLSLFDEMSFVTEHYPALRPEVILSMVTVNAAKALARPDRGTIEPERKARLIYIDLEAASARSAASQLVSAACEQVEWL